MRIRNPESSRANLDSPDSKLRIRLLSPLRPGTALGTYGGDSPGKKQRVCFCAIYVWFAKTAGVHVCFSYTRLPFAFVCLQFRLVFLFCLSLFPFGVVLSRLVPYLRFRGRSAYRHPRSEPLGKYVELVSVGFKCPNAGGFWRM